MFSYVIRGTVCAAVIREVLMFDSTVWVVRYKWTDSDECFTAEAYKSESEATEAARLMIQNEGQRVIYQPSDAGKFVVAVAHYQLVYSKEVF